MNESPLPPLPAKASKTRWGCVGAAAAIVFGLLFLTPLFSRMAPRDFKRSRLIVARNDVSQICSALKQYVVEYGAMPAGDATQIMTVLRGDNPRKIVFFEFPSTRLSPQGEYLDAWKTPYRIGSSEAGVPWAYSFGSNRTDEGGTAGSDDIASW